MTDDGETDVWTPEQVTSLGVRTNVETAGSIFGLSRTQAYEAVNNGRFPVPTFRIGRRVVVPVAPILAVLRIEAAGSPSPPVAGEQTSHADKRPGVADGTARKLRAFPVAVADESA